MELEQLIKSIEPITPEDVHYRKTFSFYMKICMDCHFGFPVLSIARHLVKRCDVCKKKVRKAYLNKLYRRTHPKPYWKEDKILDALCEGKKTMEELCGLSKSNNNAVRTTISGLRKKDHNIVKIGSYYRRIANSKQLKKSIS